MRPPIQPTSTLALGMAMIAILSWWFCIPTLPRVCGCLALCFGSISGVIAVLESKTRIPNVNEPPTNGYHDPREPGMGRR